MKKKFELVVAVPKKCNATIIKLALIGMMIKVVSVRELGKKGRDKE